MSLLGLGKKAVQKNVDCNERIEARNLFTVGPISKLQMASKSLSHRPLTHNTRE